MARPTKRSLEIQQQICALLEDGNTRTDACNCVGITDDTLQNWLKADAARGYSGFSGQVAQAESRSSVRLVAIILGAAQKEWRAAGWLLSHRHPEDWSETTRTELSGKGGGDIVIRLAYDDPKPQIEGLIPSHDPLLETPLELFERE